MKLSEITMRGKVCLVTGGGSGIGRAIALEFGRLGASVCVADLRLEAAEPVAAAIRAGAAQALAIAADVTRAAEVERMVQAAEQAFGRIDVLVNNAGGASGPDLRIGRVHRVSEADWDRTLELNLKSTFLCTRAVAPGMLERQCGSIVNMASVVGLFPFAGMPAYSASKAAIISLTRSSCMELAPHVRVNAIAPGLIETERTARNRRPEQRGQLLSNVPAARMGTVEEVANVAVFLASDAASYVSGNVVDISGGQIWMAEDGRPAFRDENRP